MALVTALPRPSAVAAIRTSAKYAIRNSEASAPRSTISVLTTATSKMKPSP